MISVLLVCVGNICRSPMAEALLMAAVPNLVAASAGTGALIGQPADSIARELVAMRGLDLGTHHARQLSAEMCQRADLILTMDQIQRRQLEARYPLCRGKVFRLAAAANRDVPDPYRQGRRAFEHAFLLIDAGVQAWADRLQKIT